MFKPAVRQEGKLRMALTGPAGAGKTLTAMRIINTLCDGKPWCVLDTENGSAAKYAGFGGFSFDHARPEDNSPDTFVKAIIEAHKAGYAGMIIDSLSHEWAGKGGCLEMINSLTAKSNSKNSYVQWGEVTPQHNKLFDVINRVPIHMICTLRVKMGYEMQKNDRTGKTEPVKIGLEPVTRDGAEYEFDIVMDMHEATGRVVKSRCPQIDGQVFKHPGEDVAEKIRAWLNGETPATMLSIPAKAVTETTPKKKSQSTEEPAAGSTSGSASKVTETTTTTTAGN